MLTSRLREVVSTLCDLAVNAKDEEVRRKACVNVLETTGLNDPLDPKLLWGIGPRSALEIDEEEKQSALKQAADESWQKEKEGLLALITQGK